MHLTTGQKNRIEFVIGHFVVVTTPGHQYTCYFYRFNWLSADTDVHCTRDCRPQMLQTPQPQGGVCWDLFSCQPAGDLQTP